MVEIGTKYQKTIPVTEGTLASNMVEGTPAVYSTIELVHLMEATGFELLQQFHGEGESNVGVSIDITHSAPTPLGMHVTCELEVIDVQKRMITFNVNAWDEGGTVATGKHVRAIVNKAKIESKAQGKLG